MGTTMTILLATIGGLVTGWLLFVWNFENIEGFLSGIGLKNRDDPAWVLMRSIEPAWQAVARLIFAVLMPALIVSLAVSTKLAQLLA